MSITFLFSVCLIAISAIFFLGQRLYSFHWSQKMLASLDLAKEAGLGNSTEKEFYQSMVKLALYFFGALSYSNMNTFFEGKMFPTLSRRLQVLSLCLWGVTFVMVPLVFLTFMQLNMIFVVLFLFGLWCALKIFVFLMGWKKISVQFGLLGLALPLVLSDFILRGLSEHFVTDDPSTIFLLLSQRGLDVQVGFFIFGLAISWILHRYGRVILDAPWLIPLTCLYLVCGYLISLPVAIALIVADRMVMAILMAMKLNETKTKVTPQEKKQFAVVTVGVLFVFWLGCVGMTGYFSTDPSPQLRALQYSSVLFVMQIMPLISTMVWGHTRSKTPWHE